MPQDTLEVVSLRVHGTAQRHIGCYGGCRARGVESAAQNASMLSALLTPPHVTDLPLDPSGRPVPAETPWPGGTPVLSKLDPARMVVLMKQARCAVCGYPMESRTSRWRGVSYDDAREFASLGQQRRRDSAGHLCCMLWSACVCPYFAAGSARRGRKGAVVGAKQLTIELVGDSGIVNMMDTTIGYRGLDRIYWFDDPAGLHGELEKAIAAEGEPRGERLYWTDDAQAKADGLAMLEQVATNPLAMVPLDERLGRQLDAGLRQAAKPMRLRDR
jgi:hypothetical protein